MMVRFLFKKDCREAGAVRGLIVRLLPSEAALYSTAGYGRVLKEGEGEPNSCKPKKAPAPKKPSPVAKPKED